jgi:thiamine biosynthesis lipoprotein ApbE/Na+-translocating ferredoxin:NAD+ oxidoreductase RnfG subunit
VKRSLVAAIFALAAAGAPSAQVFLTEEQALQAAFPGAERVEKRMLVLTAEQRAAVAARASVPEPRRILKVWVGYREGKPCGYAVIDDVLGKSQPITYMVVTDPEVAVRSVEILVYRESHGHEVHQASWRRQFEGATADGALRLGHEIRNIAGATISCRSVTDGVRRILACLSVLFPPGQAAAAAPARAAAPRAAETGARGAPLMRSRVLMDTLLELTVFAHDEATAAAAAEAAYAEVARLEAVLSNYREDSDLSVLNREAGMPPRERDPLLIDFLVSCRDLGSATGGAVDATLGPVLHLWRRAARTGRAPSDAEIERARAACGLDALALDATARRAGLTRAGAAIDSGAIGKGFALDRAARVLRERGASAALLDFGGQVLAVGTRPDGAPWPVRLRDAAGEAEGGIDLEIAAGSLSTTADYERGLVLEAQRFSHVLDPRTGRPVTGMRAVSVHCATATDADALSTALFAMGYERAVAFAREHGIAASIEGDAASSTTEGFRRLLAHGGSGQ